MLKTVGVPVEAGAIVSGEGNLEVERQRRPRCNSVEATTQGPFLADFVTQGSSSSSTLAAPLNGVGLQGYSRGGARTGVDVTGATIGRSEIGTTVPAPLPMLDSSPPPGQLLPRFVKHHRDVMLRAPPLGPIGGVVLQSSASGGTGSATAAPGSVPERSSHVVESTTFDGDAMYAVTK